MLERLARVGASRGYWWALLLLAVAMEGVALFYQYRLDYGPCVLCIHVRVWLLGVIALAAIALWLHRYRHGVTVLHGLSGLLMAGMGERSYQLLATERGWVFGSCNFDAGLPAWFALDLWLPAIFEVKEACGYTPELLFGITMAEGLLALSVGMVLLSLALLLGNLWPRGG